MKTIHIAWIDHSGLERVTRFERDYEAIRFEESLDAEGLQHWRI